MTNYWEGNPAAFSLIGKESRKVVLHPRLAAMIGNRPGLRLLDYGCGDGSLIALLDKNIEASLFDISPVLLAQASGQLKDYHLMTYTDASNIPKEYFDTVVCSLVLMTMDSKEKISAALQCMFAALVAGGNLLVAITHPCFRQQVFSTFYTAYAKGKPFNYFNDGEPFEVIIKDEGTGSPVSFFDFHYSLSTTISLIKDAGFILNDIVEIADGAGVDAYFNDSSSPYLIIAARKA